MVSDMRAFSSLMSEDVVCSFDPEPLAAASGSPCIQPYSGGRVEIQRRVEKRFLNATRRRQASLRVVTP